MELNKPESIIFIALILYMLLELVGINALIKERLTTKTKDNEPEHLQDRKTT